MKIGIIGAMPEEIAPILEEFNIHKVLKYANNEYYLSHFLGHKIIVTCSKIAKVLSALTATIMIEHFDVELLLLFGTAGSITRHLHIGDIIVATQTVQHDIHIKAFGYKKGQIPGYNISIKTSDFLRKKLKRVARNHGINLKEGIIATGDQFISNKNLKKMISNQFKADVVEMEGGSVNLVCHEFNIPCVILRCISDAADKSAAKDFSMSIEEVSKKLSLLIILFLKSF